jgi:hypothetical protein
MKTLSDVQIDSIVLSNCPQCGAKMRLFGIEPHPVHDADLITFECTRCEGVQTEDLPRKH